VTTPAHGPHKGTHTHAPDPAAPGAQAPNQFAAAMAEAEVEAFPPLPGHEIVRKLGAGGMGVVYLAKQRGLNRDVVVKTLVGPAVARAALARFWAETEVMAEVKHPNVVQVVKLGESGGRPFMAMEFVQGGSLADRLRNAGPLLPRGRGVDGGAARGVAVAHERDVVHRDLKPDNVLMDGAPRRWRTSASPSGRRTR
jgi:serine/threonine protein kinase